MLILEALRAKHGDALLLHSGTKTRPQLALIDGGPAGVFKDALRPRLEQLRAQRKLAAGAPLPIDFGMVSHIDDDHVTGVLELVRELNERREARQPVPWTIGRFWHNSFDDLLDNSDPALTASASTLSTASLGDFLQTDGSLLLASVRQGRDLAKLLDALTLAGNPPFRGLVLAGDETRSVVVGDLRLTIVGPDRKNLLALQKKWDREIKPLLKKGKDKKAAAEIAAYVDDSVHNLSSIVVLVESQGKRILLTGDGRGDHTLAGLKAAKLLKNGKLRVDVLKVPHHGSVRNVEADYFETIVADHYVISADGRFDNPDIDTLELISAARKDDRFTIHLANPPDQFTVRSIGAQVTKFFAAEKRAGRKYGVIVRDPQALSVSVALV